MARRNRGQACNIAILRNGVRDISRVPLLTVLVIALYHKCQVLDESHDVGYKYNTVFDCFSAYLASNSQPTRSKSVILQAALCRQTNSFDNTNHQESRPDPVLPVGFSYSRFLGPGKPDSPPNSYHLIKNCNITSPTRFYRSPSCISSLSTCVNLRSTAAKPESKSPQSRPDLGRDFSVGNFSPATM